MINYYSILPYLENSALEATTNHVSVDKDKWKIQLPVPGINPQNIVCSCEDRVLIVRSVPSNDTQPTSNTYSILRRWTLPKQANLDAIVASYEYGVLTVEVPLQYYRRDIPVATGASTSTDS